MTPFRAGDVPLPLRMRRAPTAQLVPKTRFFCTWCVNEQTATHLHPSLRATGPDPEFFVSLEAPAQGEQIGVQKIPMDDSASPQTKGDGRGWSPGEVDLRE